MKPIYLTREALELLESVIENTPFEEYEEEQAVQIARAIYKTLNEFWNE